MNPIDKFHRTLQAALDHITDRLDVGGKWARLTDDQEDEA